MQMHAPPADMTLYRAVEGHVPTGNVNNGKLMADLMKAKTPGELFDCAGAFTRASTVQRQLQPEYSNVRIDVFNHIQERLDYLTQSPRAHSIDAKRFDFSAIYRALKHHYITSDLSAVLAQRDMGKTRQHLKAGTKAELLAIYRHLFKPPPFGLSLKHMYRATVPFNAVEIEWLRKMFFVCIHYHNQKMGLLAQTALAFQFGYPHDFRRLVRTALVDLKVLEGSR